MDETGRKILRGVVRGMGIMLILTSVYLMIQDKNPMIAIITAAVFTYLDVMLE